MKSDPLMISDDDFSIPPARSGTRRVFLWVLVVLNVVGILFAVGWTTYRRTYSLFQPTKFNVLNAGAATECVSWYVYGYVPGGDPQNMFVRGWTDSGIVLNGAIYDSSGNDYVLYVPQRGVPFTLHLALMDGQRQRSNTFDLRFGDQNICFYRVDFTG